MDVTYITEDEALLRARNCAKEIGSNVKLAQKLGVSPQYVSAMLLGKKPLNAQMTALMGLKSETVYRQIN